MVCEALSERQEVQPEMHPEMQPVEGGPHSDDSAATTLAQHTPTSNSAGLSAAFMTQSVQKKGLPRSPREASPKRPRVGAGQAAEADEQDEQTSSAEQRGQAGKLEVVLPPQQQTTGIEPGEGASVFSPVFPQHHQHHEQQAPQQQQQQQHQRHQPHAVEGRELNSPTGRHPHPPPWAAQQACDDQEGDEDNAENEGGEDEQLMLEAGSNGLAALVLPHGQQGDHHGEHSVIPEAVEHELPPDASAEEELEYMDFDPLLFIKLLPPLDQVVPKHRPPLLPRKTRLCKQKTLVLDLDETLVHSCLEAQAVSDFTFPVHFNSQEHMIHVRQRPHLHTFMQRVAELYEVVVFTASQKIYAEKLLNIIDPERKLIKHRIFRESCVVVDGNYLKDLTALGRDLRTTLIVDNSPQAFGFQVDNGVPIESWYDDTADTELLKLLPFLESLVHVEDVRPAIRSKFRMRELIDRVVC